MAQVNSYVRLASSGMVATGECVLSGFYVNNTSTGTVRFYDGISSTGTVVSGVITPAIGYHNMGSIRFATGIYALQGNGATFADITYHIKLRD